MAAPKHDDAAGRAAAILHYLETGETDPLHPDWPGGVVESGQAAHRDFLDALVGEVQKRSAGLPSPDVELSVDLRGLVDRKVEPMVRGLFPAGERKLVQDLLAGSVVFLTPANIATVLRDCQWLSSAWDLCNLYLYSLGAELLGEEPPNIVGLTFTSVRRSPTPVKPSVGSSSSAAARPREPRCSPSLLTLRGRTTTAWMGTNTSTS